MDPRVAMTREEHERIQKDGANSRAVNGPLSSLRCPYYHADKMPAATGESIEEWQAKVDAWQLGWQAEDAIRDSSSAEGREQK